MSDQATNAFKQWLSGRATENYTSEQLFKEGYAAALAAADERAKQTERLLKEVTHPTIHIRYYDWLAGLAQSDKDFITKMMLENNPHGLIMWAWSVSRELIRRQFTASEERKPALDKDGHCTICGCEVLEYEGGTPEEAIAAHKCPPGFTVKA